MLSETGLVLVVLLSIGGFIALVAVITYMCRRHRSKSVRLDSTVLRRLVGPDDGGSQRSRGAESDDVAMSRRSSQRSMVSHTYEDEFGAGTRAIETHATLIIPNGLRLLKTCKALIHRLMATVIDFTSSASGKGLVVGSRDDIVACANTVSEAVDALTKSMYPPIDDTVILTNATELVNATEELVLVSKYNCKLDNLDWLDKATKDVLHDFKRVVDSVQKYRALHSSRRVEHVTDA